MPDLFSLSSLARNLSAARTACKLTQDELAIRAGLSRATVVQLESADGDPQLSTVTRLAEALGISPSVLLLERTDIEAIEEFRNQPPAALAQQDVDRIEALIQMRVAKKEKQAAVLGATALAQSSAAGVVAGAAVGLAPGAVAAAAIGTLLLPGLGTIIGGALGASIAKALKGRDK